MGTASSSIDNEIEIEGLKNQITEIANLMRDQKINATYNNNNPRFKRNQTRFCKFCKRSGHTIAYFCKYKDCKNENRNPPKQREKFTESYKRSRSHSPIQQNYKSNKYDNRNSRDRHRKNFNQNQSNYQNNSRSDYRHRSTYPPDSSNNYRSSFYDNRSQERQINYRTTLTEITIGKIVEIDKATVLRDQIIDIVIGVETRVVIRHLLDKAMLLIQQIAVMDKTLESTLPAKLPEAITTRTTTPTSI